MKRGGYFEHFVMKFVMPGQGRVGGLALMYPLSKSNSSGSGGGRLNSSCTTPPPALAQPLSSMRRPLLCTLKIEFSTFLFQFAFLLFLSLSCHHDHNTKREKSGYIFEKAGPKDLLCGGKNGLIYGCPKVLLLGTKIYQKRFFATLFSRYYRKQVQNEAKLLVFCCSF